MRKGRDKDIKMQYSTVSVFCSGFSLSSQNHFPGRVRKRKSRRISLLAVSGDCYHVQYIHSHSQASHRQKDSFVMASVKIFGLVGCFFSLFFSRIMEELLGGMVWHGPRKKNKHYISEQIQITVALVTSKQLVSEIKHFQIIF